MARIELPANIAERLEVIRRLEKDGEYHQPDGAYDRLGRDAWREKERQLVEQFKQDLFLASCVNLPVGLSKAKAEHLWDVAWENGHANGLHEVLIHWEELLPLALPEGGV